MLWLDSEWYQPDPLRDLRVVGSYKYAETAELTLLPYAIDDGPVKLWDLTRTDRIPTDLEDAMLDDKLPIVAHNAMFDRVVLRAFAHRTGLLPDMDLIERWRCLMVKSYTMGLPGKLEDLCVALGLPEELSKMKDARKLLLLFCKPRRNGTRAHGADPVYREKWEQFRHYAIQDVVSMRELWQMIPDWVYRGQVLDLWHLDQRINDRGFMIDMGLVDKAESAVGGSRGDLDAELADITGGAVRSHTLVAATLEWIRGEGVRLVDLQKGTVAAALRRKSLPPHVRRVLEIRREAAKSSTAKYRKLRACVCEDGRIHGGIQYYGAFRTGRAAGRLFQVHNLPSRELVNQEAAVNSLLNDTTHLLFDDVMLAASSAIRGAIVAPPEKKLVVSDESQIEARVLPWLANDEKTLDIFREGRELYVETAAEILHKKLEDVTDKERTIHGKVTTLALGYQGGPDAFNRMAVNYGVEGLPEEMVRGIVRAWRAKRPMITSFWRALNDAAFEAIRNPGKAYKCRRLAFCVLTYKGRKWLTMKLPSGRLLCYFNPKIVEVETQWGPRPQVQYEGLHQKTKKWTTLLIYGGKFAENATQGVSGDVLFGAYPRIEAAGFEIVFSVHDEIAAEAWLNNPALTEKRLSALLSEGEPWSKGLPLAAKGFEAHRFRKE